MTQDKRIPYARHRDTLVSWLRRQLIGAGYRRDTEAEEDRLSGVTPSRRYPTGILFPAVEDSAGLDAGVPETASTSGFAANEQQTAAGMLGRIAEAVERMRRGIGLLREEPKVLHAFAVANAAMLKQMQQRDRNQGKSHDREHYRWRPFQLGFFLLALESVVHRDSRYRDTVDLIWFPTGGGKTEAYLALIAFQIAWRRMQDPERAGGTTVIMRYTLRLLTQQQFQRAAMLICALELMRRELPEELGKEPITAGMWVGGATSPNRYREAMELVAKASEAPRKLVFTECPWCGTSLWDGHGGGYFADAKHFYFLCRGPECELGAGGQTPLPLNVVDHVEPTSVTPYTYQARRRALHAATGPGGYRVAGYEKGAGRASPQPDPAQTVPEQTAPPGQGAALHSRTAGDRLDGDRGGR